MRIVVLTLAMASPVACSPAGSPGRGEHIVTWPAVVFASDMMQAVSAVDESGIYAMLSTGEIAHVPLSGGAPEIVANAAPTLVSSPLVLTADEIIWADWGPGVDTGAIKAVPKRGGSIRVIAASQPEPDGLTRDATSLYWSISESPSPDKFNAIRSVPISGGTVSTLVSSNERGLYAFAVGGNHLYFARQSTNEAPLRPGLSMAAKDGSNVTLLSAEPIRCCMLSRLNEILYLNVHPARVRRFDVSSGISTTLRSLPNEGIWMAADERGVFVLETGCSNPPEGGGDCWGRIVDLATGQMLASAELARGVGLDDRYVYWLIVRDLYRVAR